MVDENTRLVARLHPDLNNRGLNIYNPYFRAADVNADYHLFPTTSIAHSFQAMKTLGIAGAITAGPFETDPTLAALTDSLSPLSRRLGKIAMVANVNGELVGHHQAAYGLLDALTGLCGPPNDLDITIVGAGTVVRALLILLELENAVPRSTKIYNRSQARAIALAGEFPFTQSIGPVTSLNDAPEGSVLINATPIGSPWNRGENFVFTDDILRRFRAIVDVTFVPLETQLTTAGARLGLPTSHGSEMFLGQAKYVLQTILQHDMDREIFRPIMLDDFRHNWS